MSLLAIDPGYTQSAWLVYKDGLPAVFGIDDNAFLLDRITMLSDGFVHSLAIESVASYGMPVGAEVFETCVWTGRFIEAWNRSGGEREPLRVYRKSVKMHLCGSMRATDTNIRAALIDRYGPGKDLAIGKKATPGVLYGITKDVWAALGVAVTASETMLSDRRAAA